MAAVKSKSNAPKVQTREEQVAEADGLIEGAGCALAEAMATVADTKCDELFVPESSPTNCPKEMAARIAGARLMLARLEWRHAMAEECLNDAERKLDCAKVIYSDVESGERFERWSEKYAR